jgi:hypothetical protein
MIKDYGNIEESLILKKIQLLETQLQNLLLENKNLKQLITEIVEDTEHNNGVITEMQNYLYIPE